jgi:membrane-associated protease RseP (regulator of RpoE activity)
MISPSRCGIKMTLAASALALAVGSLLGSSAAAQGVVSGGQVNMGATGNRGFYPYNGSGGAYPGYNIYGNYGVYGYPGSGIEGGASNSGYDPGYGGYPSYGGYGIINNYPNIATQRRLLGIDEEPVVLADGAKAMKVGKVYPGSAAEKAGLQVGDVIRSVNGYLTEQRGNLAWVIANAASNNELKLTVQTAKDSRTQVLTAMLR